LLLAALAIVPYVPALRAPLLYDDRTLLDNPWLAREATPVTVLVHDAAQRSVAGAVVSGSWGTGTAGSCTTGTTGSCTVTLSKIPTATAEVTFTVGGVTKAGATYSPAANDDPDGDSTGSAITIRR
jgi:hypothetical protein